MSNLDPFGLGGQDNTIVRCHMCGIALQTEELGLQMTGLCIDFVTKYPLNTSFTFCTECRDKIYQYSTDEDEVCLNRRDRLFGGV